MILKRIRVHAGEQGLLTNSYIVYDENKKEAMVVDPGGEPEKIIEVLDILGIEELKYIFVTHCHADHIGGINELKRAKKGKILIYENPKRLNMNKLLEELKSNTSSDQLRKTREKILNETFGLTNDDSLGVIPIEEKTSQEKEDDYQVTSSVNRQKVYMLTTRNHIVRKRRY